MQHLKGFVLMLGKLFYTSLPWKMVTVDC